MIHDVIKLVAKQRQKLLGLTLFDNFEEAVQKVVEKGQVSKEILEDELNLIQEAGSVAELGQVERETGKKPTPSMMKLAAQKDQIDAALERLFHAIDQQQDLAVVSSVIKEALPQLSLLEEVTKERLAEKVEEDKLVPADQEDLLDEEAATFFQRDVSLNVRESYTELVDASNELLTQGFGEGRAERIYNIAEKAQDIAEQSASLNPARVKRMTLWMADEAEPQKPSNDDKLFTVDVNSKNDEADVVGVEFTSKFTLEKRLINNIKNNGTKITRSVLALILPISHFNCSSPEEARSCAAPSTQAIYLVCEEHCGKHRGLHA